MEVPTGLARKAINMDYPCLLLRCQCAYSHDQPRYIIYAIAYCLHLLYPLLSRDDNRCAAVADSPVCNMIKEPLHQRFAEEER